MKNIQTFDMFNINEGKTKSFIEYQHKVKQLFYNYAVSKKIDIDELVNGLNDIENHMREKYNFNDPKESLWFNFKGPAYTIEDIKKDLTGNRNKQLMTDLLKNMAVTDTIKMYFS